MCAYLCVHMHVHERMCVCVCVCGWVGVCMHTSTLCVNAKPSSLLTGEIELS